MVCLRAGFTALGIGLRVATLLIAVGVSPAPEARLRDAARMPAYAQVPASHVTTLITSATEFRRRGPDGRVESQVKVGLVLDDTLDTPDGVQQYVLTTGSWLRNQGHDVHYLVGQTACTDIPNIHTTSPRLGCTRRWLPRTVRYAFEATRSFASADTS